MTVRLECSPMAQETGVQSQIKSYQRLKKWYLIPPCFKLSIIRYGLRVQWSNPGKGEAIEKGACGEIIISPRCKSECQFHNIQHNLYKQT